jgi:hypothetical protein
MELCLPYANTFRSGVFHRAGAIVVALVTANAITGEIGVLDSRVKKIKESSTIPDFAGRFSCDHTTQETCNRA